MTESMQHIAFEYNCDHAWSIVKKICSMKETSWSQGFDIDSIMALPLIKSEGAGDELHGATTSLTLLDNKWEYKQQNTSQEYT